jgi:hypothetical protein
MIAPWMVPVVEMTEKIEDGIFSQSDWKTSFCLEQYCSLEEVIRLSRKLQDEIREQELAMQLAEEEALQAAERKKSLQQAKKKGRSKTISSPKTAGKVANKRKSDVEVSPSKDSQGNRNLRGEHMEEAKEDSTQQDRGARKSPVVVEIADNSEADATENDQQNTGARKSPVVVEIAENSEDDATESDLQDKGVRKSSVVVEIVDDGEDDATESDNGKKHIEEDKEEMVPTVVREMEGVYEFEAKITDGAVLIKVQKMSTVPLPSLYNCLFRGYRQRKDGSIGYTS